MTRPYREWPEAWKVAHRARNARWNREHGAEQQQRRRQRMRETLVGLRAAEEAAAAERWAEYRAKYGHRNDGQ